jgi:hypothetical protein
MQSVAEPWLLLSAAIVLICSGVLLTVANTFANTFLQS